MQRTPAVDAGRPALPVFVQVNTSGEETKHGVEPEACLPLARHIHESCKHLRFAGLMTIGMPGGWGRWGPVCPYLFKAMALAIVASHSVEIVGSYPLLPTAAEHHILHPNTCRLHLAAGELYVPCGLPAAGVRGAGAGGGGGGAEHGDVGGL